MIPGWLHAAAWWAAVAVLVALFVAITRAQTDSWKDWLLGMALVVVVALLFFFVVGCPPAHSATLRCVIP